MHIKRKRALAWLEAAAVSLTVLFGGMPAEVSASNGTDGGQQAAAVSYEDAQEREILFNEDWRFCLETGTALAASGKDYDDSGWRLLDLPHDYSIEQDFDPNSPAGANGGYLNGGTGWYRKTFHS